jgi:hypothetical protein
MSAQEIPDLRTLLARRGGPGRTRGSVRGRGSGTSSHAGSEALRDNAVRGTDQDAVGSRLSCVGSGYLHDPYAALFATQPAARRLPLLNRGVPSSSQRFNQALIRPRNICPHLCHRPTNRPLPHHLPQLSQTDIFPRCRHRHTILPSQRPIPQHAPRLPRTRLPRKHIRETIFDPAPRPTLHKTDLQLTTKPTGSRPRRNHVHLRNLQYPRP